MALDKVTKRRIITIGVIAVLVVLSILTTAIPPLSPIMATDDAAVSAFNADAENAGLNKGDIAWMLTSSAFVLIMTPGLAFFYGGMVRDKNVISTLLQSYVAMGLVSVLWVVIGFSLSFGETCGGFIGNPKTYFFFNNVGAAPVSTISANIPLALYAIFQLKFAVITPALISGALAERVRFTSYVIFITLFSIFLYSPLAHMVWHPEGLLHKAGILDFAGGTVVHMSSGYSALIASWMLGKRHHAPQKVTPASIPFVMLGTALLWFGWFGFNAGSALSANPLAVQAFLTTNTAAASAMLTWIFVDHVRGSKSTAMGACVGAVVGLVAITPAAGFVTVGGALCIGIIGAVVSNLVAHVFNEKSNVDDTLDVWPCHGLGGTTGMVLTSMFATKSVNPLGADGLFYGGPTLFWHHLVALVCIVPFICVMAFVLAKITNFIYPMRVSDKSERMGLDMSQHTESMKHFEVEDDLEAETKNHGDAETSRPALEA